MRRTLDTDKLKVKSVSRIREVLMQILIWICESMPQVQVNSLLQIEQICYFQYWYWGINFFFLVFRKSSQGNCCTFLLPLLWTSWTDHIREGCSFCIVPLGLKCGDFLKLCGYMSRDTDPDPPGLAVIFYVSLPYITYLKDWCLIS